jgi:hypothetical protein
MLNINHQLVFSFCIYVTINATPFSWSAVTRLIINCIIYYSFHRVVMRCFPLFFSCEIAGFIILTKSINEDVVIRYCSIASIQLEPYINFLRVSAWVWGSLYFSFQNELPNVRKLVTKMMLLKVTLILYHCLKFPTLSEIKWRMCNFVRRGDMSVTSFRVLTWVIFLKCKFF